MSESLETITLLRQHIEFLRDHQGLRDLKLSKDARAGLNRLVSATKSASKISTPPPASIPAARTEAAPMPPVPSLPSHKAIPRSEPVPIEGQTKTEQLLHLSERASVCQKCPHLAARRSHVIFGLGNPDAELMLVGEAPGEEEDAQAEPFVGPAGQLLTKMIVAMGLTREQIYIALIVKCRPDMPPGASGNRKPTKGEMEACLPYLHAQIDVIKPKVIVALGATAMEGLLGPIGAISALRGKFQAYRALPVMPTYHPSYLLRNPSITEKRKVWEDLLAVMEKLELPISPKQRNFFLAAGK